MSDLIDRQAALDALAEDMPSAYTPDGSHPADEGIFMAQEIYADCIQTLKELPSAEPKRGKWICTGEPDESWGMMYRCSICDNRDYGGNYCSYCGAKMEDSEDETD